MSDWTVDRAHGSAAELHARPFPDPVVRTVWALTVDRPALVLGSTQPDGVVDETAAGSAGVEVVRRRSGGGAVLLEPGGATWIDVVVPATDPRWEADVGRSFRWLGEVWRAALADLGVDGVVHRGPLVRTRWSSLLCFAGLGAGEVTVRASAVPGGAQGAKVVGLAQRRTRAGARFQSAVVHRWSPATVAGLLALPPGERAALEHDLAGAVAEVRATTDDVVAAFVAHLPA